MGLMLTKECNRQKDNEFASWLLKETNRCDPTEEYFAKIGDDLGCQKIDTIGKDIKKKICSDNAIIFTEKNTGCFRDEVLKKLDFIEDLNCIGDKVLIDNQCMERDKIEIKTGFQNNNNNNTKIVLFLLLCIILYNIKIFKYIKKIKI